MPDPAKGSRENFHDVTNRSSFWEVAPILTLGKDYVGEIRLNLVICADPEGDLDS